jgi:D-amino-acid dehydrogenase
MVEVKPDVVVIGAGAIGACVALELSRAGAKVIVVDQGTGWGTGCSAGNAGILCPSHSGPFASMADVLHALAWLSRPDSPFGLVPSTRLIPWFVRLLRAMNNPLSVRRTLRVLLGLTQESLQLHEDYAAAGLRTGFSRAGLLDVYRTKIGFSRGRRAAAARAELEPEYLSSKETQVLEPLLEQNIAGAVLYPKEGHCDPQQFVAAVGLAAQTRGVELVPNTDVMAVESSGKRVRIVARGGWIDAGVAVVATGAWAPLLINTLPIVAGTGCSIDLLSGQAQPKRPMVLQEARVAITPLEGRLRLAGTMILGELSRKLDHRRLSAIYEATSNRDSRLGRGSPMYPGRFANTRMG